MGCSENIADECNILHAVMEGKHFCKKIFTSPHIGVAGSNAVNEVVFEEGFKGFVHLLSVVPDLIVLVALPAAQNDRASGLDGVEQRAALAAGQGGGGRVGPGGKAKE